MTTTGLEEKKCTPCDKNTPALTGNSLKPFTAQLGKGWKVVEEKRLEKAYKFDDFRGALDFTNRVGEMAEEEGHHPDIPLPRPPALLPPPPPPPPPLPA